MEENKKTAKAIAKHIRMSSRKANIVINLIRDKKIADAVAILGHTPKAASPVIMKVLKSAVANAENNFEMNVDDLYISEIYATQGPTLKRFRAAAQGRGVQILKRTCHITVVVSEK